MKKISIEQFETRFPNNNMEYFEKLSDGEKEKYVYYFSKYYNLLLLYLINKCELKTLDDSLVNSKNSFINIKEEDMDLYQYLSSEYLKFLYLRNNIYIERLNTTGLNYLNNIDLNNIKEEDMNFVKGTYQTLINEDLQKEVKTNFGPMDSNYFADTNSVIIGLRIQDYKANDGIDLDRMNKMEFELEFAKDYIEAKLEKVLPKVTVIRYSNDGVKKNEPVIKTI